MLLLGEPTIDAPMALQEAEIAALLANPSDKTLVVNFFATWCTPCVRELPALQTVVLNHPEARGLLVSLDEVRDAPRVVRFAREQSLRLPLVHLLSTTPSATAARLVSNWPDRIPVTLVVAPGGAERARLVGNIDVIALEGALSLGAPGGAGDERAAGR
ncbi:MAG: TlpA family protein disulfide reductase [Myxococcales bacterium]|nr:TlpA family protein disulfide reductase [Myxococcales bacterium]